MLIQSRPVWRVAVAVFAIFAGPAAFGQQPATFAPAQTPSQPAARMANAALSTPNLQARAWSVLHSGLSSSKSSDRSEAIAALSSLGRTPTTVALIEERLSDKDASVREKAVAALGNLQSHSSIPKLRAALQDGSPEVSFTAAKALWDMGEPAGREVFVSVLQGKRGASAGAWQSQLRETTEQLRSPYTLGLMGAQQAAAVFFAPAAVGVAVVGQMLRDHSAPTRAFCAEMLGLDASPQATSALSRALRDKNWMVRASAAAGMGNVMRPNAFAMLQPLLRDSKHAVRYMAAASVIRLQTPAAAGEQASDVAAK